MLLSTKILTADQRRLAQDLGLSLAEEPVLGVTYQGERAEAAFTQAYSAWIFTSQKSVQALADRLLPRGPCPPVAAVGPKTAQRLRDLGLTVALQADRAQDLATMILAEDWPRLAFFCGEVHRPELPTTLRQAGRQLDEYEVYRTELRALSQDLDKFEAVLFFSPRGVEAVLSQQPWPPQLRAYAIGPTTAQAFAAQTGQGALFPEKPTVEALLTLIATPSDSQSFL